MYILLDLNQTSNLFDPLAKQYDAKSKNGTVGNIGSTVPIIPNKRDITPTITNIILVQVIAGMVVPACQEKAVGEISGLYPVLGD